MSKIGKLPVAIPAGVTITVNPGLVTVKGPKGELKEKINDLVTVEVNGAELVVKPVNESKNAGAAHGLYRNLIHNMVVGVTEGFTKSLIITGVGYRAEVKGSYKMEFSKSSYNGTNLWVKIAKRDERNAYNIMGEHLSLRPYNDEYKEKNVNKIKEFMKGIDVSQSRIWYHMNLRNYNENIKNDRFNKERKKWKNY